MSELTRHVANDEAALWAVRLEGAPLSQDEQRELDAWLEAAPHHRGALIRAKAVWLNLGRLGAVAGPTNSSSLAGSPPFLDSSLPAKSSMSAAPQNLSRAPRRRMVIALAASFAVVLFAFLGFRSLRLAGETYETGIGEVRRIALEDGSAITLNSGSKVAVRFEKDLRAVRLERGEAFFEVAKNKSRPFMVWSGEVSVRAVGTTFAVRVQPDDVSITVTEGIVEVAQHDAPPQRVTVNERAYVRPKQAVQVTPEDHSATSRQLAWRDGLVSFSGESLGEAVLEVNRYSRRKIEIDDPALAAKPVVGVFRVGDVDAFAQTAAAALGAQVQADDRIVRLTVVHQPD